MTGSITSFSELMQRFFALYGADDFQGALDLLRSDDLDLPHHAPVIAFWEVAMLARLGQNAEAMTRLRTAVEAGYWMHEEGLRGDPDYASLLTEPGIDAITHQLQAARLAAAAEIEPLLSIMEPENGTQPWPLLLALHGNLGNIPVFAPHFTSAARNGWLVAVPQSVQPTWVSDFYVWDDEARAQHQIAHHYHMLNELYQIDAGRTVLAGFSKGGEVAMKLALEQQMPARGFIGVEGWLFDLEAAPALIDAAVNKKLRVYLISGQDSQFKDDAPQLRDLLVARGFACELEMTDLPYHGFPANFEAVLQRALAFVMDM